MGKNRGDEDHGASSQLELNIVAEGSFGSSPDDHPPLVLLLSVKDDDKVHRVFGVHSQRQARDLIRKLRVTVTPKSQREVLEYLEESSELPDEESTPSYELPAAAVGPFMYHFVLAQEGWEEDEDGEEDDETDKRPSSGSASSDTRPFPIIVPARRTGEVVEAGDTQPTTDVVPPKFLRAFSMIPGVNEE